jgi:hypothetical protein
MNSREGDCVKRAGTLDHGAGDGRGASAGMVMRGGST